MGIPYGQPSRSFNSNNSQRRIMITDRYVIDAYETSELLEASNQDRKQALQHAISVAEARSRIYALPCTWVADFRDDGTILVKRYRNSKKVEGQ